METLARGLVAAAVLAVLAAGCGGRDRGCPVTLNNTRIPPPGEHPRLAGTTSDVYYASGRLWTILGDDGIVREKPRADGSVAMKFPWWRGVRGRLTIAGRRLDGSASALRAVITDGYGPIGFQASAIIFPTAGCWRVSATAGTARLSFVTLVVEPGGQ
jgi:hypothetical protein